MKTLLGCGVFVLIGALVALGLAADSTLIWLTNGAVAIGIIALVLRASGGEKRR